MEENKDIKKACGNCKFFENNRCKRNAPVILNNDVGANGKFPIISPADICGEFSNATMEMDKSEIEKSKKEFKRGDTVMVKCRVRNPEAGDLTSVIIPGWAHAQSLMIHAKHLTKVEDTKPELPDVEMIREHIG